MTNQLESLLQTYQTTLSEYQKAVREYDAFLRKPTSTPTWVSIAGHAYPGKASLEDKQTSTLNACEALCASNPKCSGATFVAKQCKLKSGAGPIITSSNSKSYAIVPTKKELVSRMERLNKKLLDTNDAIQKQLAKPPKEEAPPNLRSKLVSDYAHLTMDRKAIETAHSPNNEVAMSAIDTTQQYYQYWVWCIALALLLVMGGRMLMTPSSVSTVQYGGDLGTPAYGLVGLLILVVCYVYMVKDKLSY